MLNECASCHEPLFDLKACPQCGAANPTYQAPRWRRNALIAGLLLMAIIVGSIVTDVVPAVYLMLGVAVLSIGTGVAVLWNRGPTILLLWLVGNGGVFVLTFVATVGALLVLRVRLPFFLIYGLGASLLLKRLKSRPNAA
jgi:hypothetical protein